MRVFGHKGACYWSLDKMAEWKKTVKRCDAADLHGIVGEVYRLLSSGSHQEETMKEFPTLVGVYEAFKADELWTVRFEREGGQEHEKFYVYAVVYIGPEKAAWVHPDFYGLDLEDCFVDE